jgi:hypothetical protein
MQRMVHPLAPMPRKRCAAEPDTGQTNSSPAALNVTSPAGTPVESESVSTSPEPVAHGTRDRGPARWALAAFILTFTVTRVVTTALHIRGDGTSGGLMLNGVHIHHMVWGLIILGIVGFTWLARPDRRSPARWQSVCLGIGWALVLDELALIINLRDVYWTPLGDESFVAVAVTIVALAWLSFRPVRKHS